MRNVLPLALLMGLAGCASPSRWEKPGVDQSVAVRDQNECRQAARQEANRYPYPPTPYFGGPFGGWRRPSYFLWQSDFESDRFFTENRLAAFCMRSRGYELVPIEQPQTRPPAAPPSQTPTDK
ncbi:MAG: hypothetical protein ACHQK9_08290 [Reyranellales bacterium]